MSNRLFYDGWIGKDGGELLSRTHGARPVLSSRRGGSVPTNYRRPGMLHSSASSTPIPPLQRKSHFNVPANQVMSKENLPGHVIASLPGHTFGETSDSGRSDLRLSNPARHNTMQSQRLSESALHLSGSHVNIGPADKASRFNDFSQYYAVLVGTIASTGDPAVFEASESCNFYTGLTDRQALELKTLVKNKITAKNAFDEVSVVRFLTALYYSNYSLNKVGLIELIEDLGAAYVITDPLRIIKERNKRKGLNIYGEPLDQTMSQGPAKSLMASRGPSKEIPRTGDIPIPRLETPELAPAQSSTTSVLRSLPETVSIGVGSMNINTESIGPEEAGTPIASTQYTNKSLRLNLLPDAPPLLHESLLVSSRHRSPSLTGTGGTPRPDNHIRPTIIEGSIPPQSDIDLAGKTPRPDNTHVASPTQLIDDGTSPTHAQRQVKINYADASGLLSGPDESAISLATVDHHRRHGSNPANYTLNYLTSLDGESTVGYDGPPDINKEPYVIGRFIDPYGDQ